MTTTETPTDNSTPDAPDPAATAEPSHAPSQGEPATNGEAQAAAVPSAAGAVDTVMGAKSSLKL